MRNNEPNPNFPRPTDHEIKIHRLEKKLQEARHGRDQARRELKVFKEALSKGFMRLYTDRTRELELEVKRLNSIVNERMRAAHGEDVVYLASRVLEEEELLRKAISHGS